MTISEITITQITSPLIAITLAAFLIATVLRWVYDKKLNPGAIKFEMACAIILAFLNSIAFMDSGRAVSAIAAVLWACLAVLQAFLLTRCEEETDDAEEDDEDVEEVVEEDK